VIANEHKTKALTELQSQSEMAPALVHGCGRSVALRRRLPSEVEAVSIPFGQKLVRALSRKSLLCEH
jgi:hypothetical protein